MIINLLSNSNFGISKFFKRLLIILILSSFSNIAYPQSFAIGHTTKAFVDKGRNRTIEVAIYHPSVTSGNNIIAASGNFPVLIFGPGFLMTLSAYRNFWENLVPEGYIICFPKTEGSLIPNHGNFGKDLSFIASAMQSENTISTSLFFNVVAPKTALMGHSMGGGASFLAAANNMDIDALVNFAAAETNPSAISASQNVTVPTLIFSGSDDCVTPEGSNQNLMYDNLISSCKTQVSITNGGHCYFANSNTSCSLGEAFCNSSLNITRAQQQNVTFEFLKLWLQDKLYENETARTDFNDLLESSSQITFRQSCETLHVEKNIALNSIFLFPIPVIDKLSIRLSDDNAGGILQVFNVMGQQVVNTQLLDKQMEVNVSQLQGGFYFYTYSKNGLKRSGKFIKDGRD